MKVPCRHQVGRGAALRARLLLLLAITSGMLRQTQCPLRALKVSLLLAASALLPLWRTVVFAALVLLLSLVCCRAIPGHGGLLILRDTCSVLVREPEIELALDVPLSSCLAEPVGRRIVVLRHALSLQEHSPEIVLRLAMSLFSRLSIPTHSSLVILRDTYPILVHSAQAELRVGVALISCFG